MSLKRIWNVHNKGGGALLAILAILVPLFPLLFLFDPATSGVHTFMRIYDLRTTAEIQKTNFITLLSDTEVRLATSSHADNAMAFSCIGVSCNHGETFSVKIFDSMGNVYSKVSADSDFATFGLNHAGEPCNTFGDNFCFFKIQAHWVVDCGPYASCPAPIIKFNINLEMKDNSTPVSLSMAPYQMVGL